MSARTDLRDQLRAEEQLDERFLIPDNPGIPNNTAAAVRWVLSVELASVKPGPMLRSFENELHVILASVSTDPDAIESDLEVGLDIVLELLATSVTDYGFVSADRDVADNKHCYDLTFTIASTVTKE